jgi:hypothetical protein
LATTLCGSPVCSELFHRSNKAEISCASVALQASVCATVDSGPDGVDAQPERTTTRATDKIDMFLIGGPLVVVGKW